MSDQDSISPYNNNTVSSRQVMGIKKNMNCLAVSREISIINEILGVKWLTFKIDIFE